MYPEFRVTAGSVTVTSSGQSLAAGNWYYIEIGVYFAASGETLELKIELKHNFASQKITKYTPQSIDFSRRL